MASRFIPACAGNGSRWPRSARSAAVHPRVCGERWNDGTTDNHDDGSSPRVRGTAGPRARDQACLRFIPACAGNGTYSGHGAARVPVHPRVCGERIAHDTPIPAAHGSSPRVRGTANPGVGARDLHRFIPACAGNGGRSPSPSDGVPVHPRVCGERYAGALVKISEVGSSPRVRGTAADGHRQPRPWRFIPACAGNGRRGSASRPHPAVHPRVCGERRSTTRRRPR